jgi:hypothetical protein
MSDNGKKSKRYKKIDEENFEVGGRLFAVDDFPCGVAAEVLDESGGLEKISENFTYRKAVDFINSIVNKLDPTAHDKWAESNVVVKDALAVAGHLIRFFTPDLGQEEATKQD